ncbi:MAG: CHASE2 domain-containing protein, partial [Symploca sp. SIO1C4]|nr:CHASE2 domain-containing protein [Symploca sp. SIO1C4]
MSKLAVLELKGNLNHQGFFVTLHISQGNITSGTTIDGYLPASTQLLEDLIQWQQDYRHLSGSNRVLKPYKIKHDGTINPIETCTKSAQKLLQQFQSWLRSESFRNVELHLRQELKPNDSVQLLIRTTNSEVQALPWHLWDFIEQYPQAEIALSGVGSYPSFYKSNLENSNPNKVNILAVLGDSKNIDIESDRKTLNQLTEANVEFLVEPTHQKLNDILYEQSWDILFFAGHSQTESEGQGILRLNSTTELTIDEIRYGVRRSIANGLQLAIFNSCDGLGLAHALTKLQLPQMIVMREAVPDFVAQEFLKYFLRAFSQGQSLHLAQREARERLQGMEKTYPCASWLPVIYQPSVTKPLNWFDLFKHEHETTSTEQVIVEPKVAAPTQKSRTLSFGIKFGIVLVCSVLVSSVVLGMRSLGLLQGWELKAFDHLMRLRSGQNIPDNRILIVKIEEEDIQAQRNQGMKMEGSLADQALLELLQKISPHQPSVIGLDIIHDFPFSTELQSHLKEQNLIAICQAMSITSKLPGIKPPEEDFMAQKLGFNNVPVDVDGVLRRQFLGMPPKQFCPAEQSFGFRIAQRYLEDIHGMKKEWVRVSPNRNKKIQLGSQIFPRLERNAGGYQLSQGDANGYQVLVNYRTTSPKQVNLREILSGSLESQLAGLISDRIILIGVVDRNIDTHPTPYSKGLKAEEMPGVVVQAHMISQIISAALGERPLLSWWTEWLETLWIG